MVINMYTFTPFCNKDSNVKWKDKFMSNFWYSFLLQYLDQHFKSKTIEGTGTESLIKLIKADNNVWIWNR